MATMDYQNDGVKKGCFKKRLQLLLSHFLAVSMLVAFGTGCAIDLYNESSLDNSACSEGIPVSVEPAYPVNGALWNDFVRVDGSSNHDLSDTACVPGSDTNCFNGGILRAVDIPNETSCLGLSGSDTLSAFHWKCYDGGANVKFFSTKFNDGKGLRDLVQDSSSLKNIAFQVTRNNCIVYESTPSSTWWSNAIQALPDSSTGVYDLSVGNGHSDGTIFVQDTDALSRGYIVNLNKISIVTTEASQIVADAGLTANCNGSGEAGTAGSYFLCIGNQNFVWIEIDFEDSNGVVADEVMSLRSAHHFTLHNSTIQNTANNGILYWIGNGPRFSQSTLSSLGGYGLSIYFANGAKVYRTRVDQGGGYGVYFSGSSNSRANQLIVSNVSNSGFSFDDASANSIATQSLITNSNIYTYGPAAPVTLHAVSAMNSATNGFSIQGDDMTLTSALSVNNSSLGISVNTDNFTTAQTVAISNGSSGFSISGNDARAYSNIIVGNNSSSCVITGTGSWIQNGTCDHGDAGYSSSADTSGDATDLVIGLVSSDYENLFGADAVEAFATLTDWSRFDSFWRAWSVNTSNTWPHSDYRTSCTSGACQIFDYRLNTFNATGLIDYNGSFIAGGPCPASVDASNSSNYITDLIGNTYLLNAVEITEDWVGDDDGLCENNEDCIFHPSFGHYLGEGSLSTVSCSFSSGGGFTSVNIYGYSVTATKE